MAWQEQVAQRGRKSRLYQDDINPLKRAYDGSLTIMHYEDLLDSGAYVSEVDCAPLRTVNAQLDGWRVVDNGWHYAIGRPAGKGDGWVGYGGRKGAHWLQFKLQRVGYLHWPTRAWDDLGGTPDYDRGNLTHGSSDIYLPTMGDIITAGASGEWRHLWKPPGGGEVSATWYASGGRLGKEIEMDPLARGWRASHPPATPDDETWFGFVIELDWSDIPRVVRDGVLQSIDGDFADDGQPIHLNDGSDNLLGLLPPSYAYVRGIVGSGAPLRKRFYSEGGKHYLLLGLRVDVLNGMPAGELVFDPTIDESVGASADDGYVRDGAQDLNNNDTVAWMGYFDNASWTNVNAWQRYTNISGLSGATIDVSNLTMDLFNKTDTPELKIRAERAAAPGAPSTWADYDGRTKTTAGVDWDDPTAAAGQTTPSLNAVFQEVADNHDPSTIVMYLLDDKGLAATHLITFLTEDHVTATAPALHIEYTAAAAGIVPFRRRIEGY